MVTALQTNISCYGQNFDGKTFIEFPVSDQLLVISIREDFELQSLDSDLNLNKVQVCLCLKYDSNPSLISVIYCASGFGAVQEAL